MKKKPLTPITAEKPKEEAEFDSFLPCTPKLNKADKEKLSAKLQEKMKGKDIHHAVRLDEPKEELTAMSGYLEFLESEYASYMDRKSAWKEGSPYYETYDLVIRILGTYIARAQSLLPKEKEQIVEACSHGLQHGTLNIKETAEQYFNEKYNSL